jgi:hypothetical protein
MSPDSMRVAVAMAMGWKLTPSENQARGMWTYTSPSGVQWNFFYNSAKTPEFGVLASEYLPDYLNDLNAINEAFRTYRHSRECSQFFFLDHQKELWKVVTGRDFRHPDIDHMHSLSMEEVIHATAAQRTEAFLKALGLYDGTEAGR